MLAEHSCCIPAECTLDVDPQSFWSSTGSQSPEANEFLLYKLSSPLCLIQHVSLSVFRAHYQVSGLLADLRQGVPATCRWASWLTLSVACPAMQFGEPLYPPTHISFQAGPTPWHLSPASLKFAVAAIGARRGVCSCGCGLCEYGQPCDRRVPGPCCRRRADLSDARRPAGGTLPAHQSAWQAAATVGGHAGARTHSTCSEHHPALRGAA